MDEGKVVVLSILIVAIALVSAISIPVVHYNWREHAKEIAAIEAGMTQCRVSVPGSAGGKTIWVTEGTCPIVEMFVTGK